MYWKIEIELSINENTKSSQTNTFPHFLSMWEKVVRFTDLTHAIYWSAKINKKDNLDNLSLCASTKYVPNNVCVSWHFQTVMHNI